MRLTGIIAAGVAAIALQNPVAGVRVGRAVDNGSPPDRLSVDRNSKFYDPCVRRVGVKFNGVDRPNDTHEYCVSEGWIVVRARNKKGKFRRDEYGHFVLEKLEGVVEPYYQRHLTTPTPIATVVDEASIMSAAEAKRKRKAEKRAAVALRQKFRDVPNDRALWPVGQNREGD